jgi:NodT family efflux transporter outer membrane factor (OMF) lipoprotein
MAINPSKVEGVFTMTPKCNRQMSFLLALCIGLALAGCATTEPPTQTAILADALPETTVIPGKWTSAAEAGEVPDGWLKSYHDPRMEAVVGEALKNNLGLRTASANLDAAAGAAKIAGARLKPTVGLGGGGSSQTTSGGGGPSQSYGADINVAWELDIWGRLRTLSEASEQEFQAAQADFEFARQSLAAQTAKSWYLATEALQQRNLAEQYVAKNRRILELIQKRQSAGRVAEQDVALARADLASAEESLRGTEAGFQQAVRSLELLLGRYPSAEMEVAEEFVPVPPIPPAGMPSTLLERRFDLVAAERQVKAQFQQVEAAKLAKLPSFSLTSSAGASSNALNDMLGQGPGFFNVGANFLAPIFSGGRLDAQVDIQTAQQEAALANYGQQALVAFSEVESGLANLRLLRERVQFQSAAVTDNATAVEKVQRQLEVGRVDLLSVLQIQSRELAARSSLIRLQNAELLEHINLHLALGGDFE